MERATAEVWAGDWLQADILGFLSIIDIAAAMGFECCSEGCWHS